MPEIVSATHSPNSCSHYHVTIGGRQYVFDQSEMNTPLNEDDIALMFKLLVRYKGIALANLAQRVIVGDEATNVKTYDLLPPGSAVTKTNIGTAWTNVLPGANGQRVLVDFTGCTEFLIVLTANLVGTGPFGARVVRDSDNAVLFEESAIAQTGERELQTAWLPLPVQNMTQELVRFQMKSAVAADDPVVRRCQLLVR